MSQTPTPTVVEHHRLSREQFEKLRAKMPAAFVNENTTSQMAGFYLGIQYALRALEEGFVIG